MAPPELSARGERVEVSTVREQDEQPYRAAVRASTARLARWNPVDPDDLGRHRRAQSSAHRTFVIRALDPEGAHGIVGKVNVTNVVRGRFRNGTMGYDSYDPYAGRGLFADGLRLVVDLAFAAEPHGMDLHRLEANVQPGNAVSAGVLRSLGFRREGHAPRMLWLTDGNGPARWRDHDTYALTADEWPARPYAPHESPRPLVLVNGVPSPPRAELARLLSRELMVPLVRADQLDWAAVWALLADAPAGAVLEADLPATGQEVLLRGLGDARLQPEQLLQVCCNQQGREPLRLAQTTQLDAQVTPTPRVVAALALQARAIAAGWRA